MIKAVLIDIDDTLLSFQEFVREAIKHGFRKFGLGEYREEMYEVFTRVNSAMWRDLEDGKLSFEELKKTRWNKVFKALRIRGDGVVFEGYFRDFLFDSAIPQEGALSLLEYLKPKYVLCAASNGPYAQQVNRLKTGGMLLYFDHLFISEEMGYSKPSKEFFDLCFHRLNNRRKDIIRPQEMLILGDSLSSDIKGGIGAGIKTAFYNPFGKILPDGITPDFTVKHLMEMKTIL